MKKTLQDQYLLIKEGKGHKGVFIKEAKRQFPGLIRNAATFTEVANVLKTKNLINENVIGLEPINQLEPSKKESYEVAFENFLAEAKKKKVEDEKAELKKPSKQVEEDAEKNFDYSDKTNPDNLIFDQIMKGYYTEMKDPKNEDKTVEELKAIVFKNLEKNPTYYTEKGQFGVKDLGYTMDLPGLGEPKEPKGKFKSSGYGDLKESKKPSNEDYKPSLRGYDVIDKDSKEIIDSNLPKHVALKMAAKKKGWMIRATDQLAEETQIPIPYTGQARPTTPEEDEEFAQEVEREENEEDALRGGRLELDEEDKLREAIRSMINEELEEGYDDREMNIYPERTSGVVPDTRHEKNPQDRGTYLNAIKGMTKLEAIEHLGKEGLSSSMVMRILNKADRMGMFDVQDMFDINPRIRGDVFEIRKVIRESIEKELAQINKEAEYEVLDSKLEKITDLIDRRKSRLAKLDEDEDIKALTDKKKVKQFEKEIKTLEKAKFKIEKVLAKKAKSAPKAKAIIDEDEELEEGDTQDAIDKIKTTVTDVGKTIDDELVAKLEEDDEEDDSLEENNTYGYRYV